jgi:hypothetical protein
MPGSRGLSHIAMSVPPGTLTEDHREAVRDFYGSVFQWREIESLRLPDRLTFAVGGSCYINIRERAESMRCTGYEHFGVLLSSAEDVELLWADVEGHPAGIHPEPIETGKDGSRSFFFQHLLPFAVEVQFLPGMHVGKRSLPEAFASSIDR